MRFSAMTHALLVCLLAAAALAGGEERASPKRCAPADSRKSEAGCAVGPGQRRAPDAAPLEGLAGAGRRVDAALSEAAALEAPRRVEIIVNPTAGRGKAARVAGRLADRLRAAGDEVTIAETRRPGDARRIAAAASGFDAVAAVGGDGTASEVASGLPPGGPALAVVPSGTANVLAKSLGLRRGPGAAVAALRGGRERSWDVGRERASDRRFLLFAEAGYTASVISDFHERRTGPIRKWEYYWWSLKGLLRYRAPAITVELDGRRLPAAASWVQVSNVAAYAGPFSFTPKARPDDGVFEVMVVEGAGRGPLLRALGAAALQRLLGRRVPAPGVSIHRARRVRLDTADGRPVPLAIDGDAAGSLPFDAELMPDAIRVLSRR